MRSIAPGPETPCWHCGQAIERSGTSIAGRYIYRADQAHTAIVEDWIECSCGAYQNVRRLNEITVESVGKS